MQLTLNSPKIVVFSVAVDFRKAIDGLCEVVSLHCKLKLTAAVFIFFNKHRNKVKILAWYGNGFMLLYKRLEQGKFPIVKNNLLEIDNKQLSWLLAGLDWISMRELDHLEYDNYH